MHEAAINIVKTLVKAGYTAYFAGGWVRDYLLGHDSDDIDIATNAPVKVIQDLFPKTIPVGIAFGIIIVIEDGHQFEVARFRKDSGYMDGRRPVGIELAEPEEDAQRRDFTINGMFYDPLTQELYDYVGGREDLKKRCVRAIGDPHERFSEDRLRMLRAVRYATRFNYAIDPATVEAIKEHASEVVPAVAIERIWHEFEKISKFEHMDDALAMMAELGLLSAIFPTLEALTAEEVRRRMHRAEKFPKDVPTIAHIMQLFPKITAEELDDFCKEMKLSNRDRDFALFLHDSSRERDDHEWALFYAHDFANLVMSVDKDPMHKNRIKELHFWIERLRERDPIITSRDLMALGVKPGIEMGRILTRAEKIAVNQRLKTKEEVLNRCQ